MARRVWLALLAGFLAGCTPMPEQTRAAISDWRSGKPDADCELPGTAEQWQADFCLAEVQTDDLIAAEPCLEHERRRRKHGEECARRRHYKQEWCRTLVDNRAIEASLAECIADPQRMGPVVKGGGL